MEPLSQKCKHYLEGISRTGGVKASQGLANKLKVPLELFPVEHYLIDNQVPDSALSRIAQHAPSIAVKQKFFGDLSGFLLFPFTKSGAKQFLGVILGEKSDDDELLTDKERDILGELLNMVCGHLIGSLSDQLGCKEIRIDPPSARQFELSAIRRAFQEAIPAGGSTLVVELKIMAREREATMYWVVGFPAVWWKRVTETAETIARAGLEPGAKSVLLVDDSAFSRSLSSRIMAKLGYHTDEAGTGKEALEKYDPNKHDLVFLDITLPDADGFQILEALLKSHPKARVVMITARVQENLVADLKKAGALDVIFKPLEEEKLSKVLSLA